MKRLLALLVVAALGSGCAKACGTAERMADQTVFNADKHVWTYEEFHRKWEAYQQYDAQEKRAGQLMADLEEKGQAESERYGRLAMEYDGARNMKYRIASEYNKMSKVAYQAIWKSKGLPERLDP